MPEHMFQCTPEYKEHNNDEMKIESYDNSIIESSGKK